MPGPLLIFLVLSGTISTAYLLFGVYLDHVRHQRRRRLEALRNTPSPLQEVHQVIGGHRGPEPKELP